MAKKKVVEEEVEVIEPEPVEFGTGQQVKWNKNDTQYVAFVAQVNDDGTFDLFVLRENNQYVRNVSQDAIEVIYA